MNMGGPGDHWYTDIFVWNRPAFGEPSDSLIREIQRLGGAYLLRDEEPLARRLWQLWPLWGPVDEQSLKQLALDLARIRESLRSEAVAKGWEVD